LDPVVLFPHHSANVLIFQDRPCPDDQAKTRTSPPPTAGGHMTSSRPDSVHLASSTDGEGISEGK
jgi:hypothetical protein